MAVRGIAGSGSSRPGGESPAGRAARGVRAAERESRPQTAAPAHFRVGNWQAAAAALAASHGATVARHSSLKV